MKIRYLRAVSRSTACLLASSVAAALAVAMPGTLGAREASPQTGAAATPSAADDAAMRAWGFADSDISLDPAIRLGVLDNGMRYALRRNTTPKDSVIVRLRFDAGSFEEAEDQRGLAHFLEHMAFNGSTGVPEGEMVKLLERKGLAFGADTNASTGFDETVYQLDLPNGSADMIDTALMLMRETASELLLDPAAIERERGIILAERRSRDSYQLRNYVDMLAFEGPTMRAAQRMPIGDETVIKTAPPERIRAFYDAYYRPERATLVIVGDFDVDAVEAKLRARFGDWRGRGAAGADADPGRPDFNRPSEADIFVDPAIAESVRVSWYRPYVDEPDRRAVRQRQLIENIAQAIINRRLAQRAMATDSPLLGAGLGDSQAWDAFDAVSVSATVRDGRWADALALIEQEVRRVVEHGFGESEVQEQLANFRTTLRNRVAGADTRHSGALAAALLGAADSGRVVSTPAEALAMFEEAVAGLTAEQLNAVWRARVAGMGEPIIRVTSKTEIAGGTEAVLAKREASQAVAVAAPTFKANAEFAYRDFGAPGRVVSDTRMDQHGIRRIRFANNVMLNIKKTDFQKDTVYMMLRVDGGSMLATREDPTRVALGSALSLGGLEAHSVDELRSILAGTTVDRAMGMGPDYFGGAAVFAPADLLLQAQLLTAYVTAPGYRADGLELVRRSLPQQYAANDASPSAAIGRDIDAILTGDDPRTRMPPLETMLALDWEGLKAAIGDSLDHGAIEIGLVGDVDEEAAIKAIAASFGALPERRAAFDAWTEARQRSFAADRNPRIVRHKGGADQAELRLYWPARDDSDLNDSIGLSLMAEIMKIRLTEELRERLGKSYSPGAVAMLSDIFPGFGHMMVAALVAPGDLATVEAAIRDIAAELRDQPVSADLIDRARTPMRESMVKARRDNGYWFRYVAIASSRPDRLDRIDRAIPALDAVDAARLQQLAARYLVDDTALVVKAISDKAPDAAAP